ncbi:MAG: superoxide dismutase family protein, partial [Myxococcaceae bacterium]|nr:superoxide dismutase family protein [Myxococcaceae bacterium]
MNFSKLGVGVAVLVVSACTTMDERRAEPQPLADAIAKLGPTSGSTAKGTVEFMTSGTEVQLKLEIAGISPGRHGVHLHEKGDCSSPDGESAGGHWDPMGHQHGQLDVPPAHYGDIGNIEVGGDGRGTLVFATSYWSVGTGRNNDILGKAVVVHDSVDDFTSQPAGNSGKRIACG